MFLQSINISPENVWLLVFLEIIISAIVEAGHNDYLGDSPLRVRSLKNFQAPETFLIKMQSTFISTLVLRPFLQSESSVSITKINFNKMKNT